MQWSAENLYELEPDDLMLVTKYYATGAVAFHSYYGPHICLRFLPCHIPQVKELLSALEEIQAHAKTTSPIQSK